MNSQASFLTIISVASASMGGITSSSRSSSRLFTQPFIQGADQRDIKFRVTGHCEGNSTVI